MKEKNPLVELVGWFNRMSNLATAMLFVLVTLSAVGIVGASHEIRNKYRELQVLQKARDDLENEYGKLLLEQSAWANYTRVDQIAREELGMTVPLAQEIVTLRRQD